MLKKYSPLFAALGMLVLAFFIWYFWDIVIYVIIAAILSIIGQPLARAINKLKIGNYRIPVSVSALVTLLVMLMLFGGFIWFIVPLISDQAKMISEIDMKSVTEHFRGTISSFEEFLVSINVVQPGETIESALRSQLESVVTMATFSNIFSKILTTTGSFFMGAFSILFITFFFLRDEHMLQKFILLIVPEQYEEQVRHVMSKSKKLLTRYFLGLLGELLSMMTLLTIGLSIIGVKNALIIGFLGGLMNIVPYLGPIIGASIGVIFGVTSALSLGMYDQLIWLVLGTVLVFLFANGIDNVLLQPLIYSNVVKARPIEIFLVIIMAGSIAGIPGMILAIPSYTVIRILGKEFLSQFRLVKKLTEKL